MIASLHCSTNSRWMSSHALRLSPPLADPAVAPTRLPPRSRLITDRTLAAIIGSVRMTCRTRDWRCCRCSVTRSQPTQRSKQRGTAQQWLRYPPLEAGDGPCGKLIGVSDLPFAIPFAAILAAAPKPSVVARCSAASRRFKIETAISRDWRRWGSLAHAVGEIGGRFRYWYGIALCTRRSVGGLHRSSAATCSARINGWMT